MNRHVITVIEQDGEKLFSAETGTARLWAIYWLVGLTVELHRDGALFDKAVGRSIGTHGAIEYLEGFALALGKNQHDDTLTPGQFQVGDQLIVETPNDVSLRHIFYHSNLRY